MLLAQTYCDQSFPDIIINSLRSSFSGRQYDRDFILICGSHNGRRIFVLLAKMIAFHVQFAVVHICAFDLEWLFLRPKGSDRADAR